MIALTLKEAEAVQRVRKSYMVTKKIKKSYTFGEAIKDMLYEGYTEWDDLKISDDDFEIIGEIVDRFLDSESDIDFIKDYLDML